MTELDIGVQQPAMERGSDSPADKVTFLPFVPSFGWRPGQSDFPVPLIAASDVFPSGRILDRAGARDLDLFPHVEVLAAPRRRNLSPVRVLAALVLVGAAVAATLAVFDRAGSPGDQAAVVATATSESSAPTAASTSDDTRQPQPGFGGGLPSPGDDEAEETPDVETPDNAGVSATESPTASVDPTPTSPSSINELPGSGVATVSTRLGDSLLTIAEKFGVSVSSLLWSNPEASDPTAELREGTVVRVPRVDGVVHEIQTGDTLAAIAERYDVDPDAITGYGPNDIEKDSDLIAGELLLVPDGHVADRGSLDEYIVQKGDTLTDIADYFGVQPQTLVWANELPDPTLIHEGQTLLVPPGDGALVNVIEGDTVEGIAEQFSVDPAAIYDYEFNGLGGDAILQAGQYLMVPGDFLPQLPDESPLGAVAAGEDVQGPATGTFIWPAEGWVSQEYHTGHLGIDLANEAWTPINAMDGGVVIFAGWSDYGLGYAVGIDHGNGFQTWYGHFAAQPYVEVGQIIWQGGYLGPMGSTGRSTGPHLHLAMLEDGIYVNPSNYLQ